MRFLRRGKSLSGDITLVYASLSISLVVLLSFIAYRMNSRVLEERIRQDLLQGVDQAIHRINAEIDERAREVQTLRLTAMDTKKTPCPKERTLTIYRDGGSSKQTG